MEDYEHLLKPGKTVLVNWNSDRYLLLSERRCLRFSGKYSFDFRGRGWDLLKDIGSLQSIYHLNPSKEALSFTTDLTDSPMELVWRDV